MDSKDLLNRFTYHQPKTDQPQRYQEIRKLGYAFATYINENVVNSKEKEVAIQKLEEAVMWANAGIARNE